MATWTSRTAPSIVCPRISGTACSGSTKAFVAFGRIDRGEHHVCRRPLRALAGLRVYRRADRISGGPPLRRVSRDCRSLDRRDNRLRPTPPVIPAFCRSMRRSAAEPDWLRWRNGDAKHSPVEAVGEDEEFSVYAMATSSFSARRRFALSRGGLMAV